MLPSIVSINIIIIVRHHVIMHSGVTILTMTSHVMASMVRHTKSDRLSGMLTNSILAMLTSIMQAMFTSSVLGMLTTGVLALVTFNTGRLCYWESKSAAGRPRSCT